jgi:hypothetical protein
MFNKRIRTSIDLMQQSKTLLDGQNCPFVFLLYQKFTVSDQLKISNGLMTHWYKKLFRELNFYLYKIRATAPKKYKTKIKQQQEERKQWNEKK